MFANVEEACHSRKGGSTFDFTNISGILPDGKTHVSRRYSLFCTQLSKPLGKLFFVQSQPYLHRSNHKSRYLPPIQGKAYNA